MNAQRYNAGARALHWIIAVMIIANLITGLFHDAMKGISVMPTHKAIGLTVLVLSVLRLVWRLMYKPPPSPGYHTGFEVFVSKVMHGLLYVLMIAMPLSGWIMSSPGPRPLTWFGIFDWPKLAVVKDSPLAEFAHNFHGIGGWITLLLILGHVGAALRHHFILKDGTLRRML